MKIVIVLFAFAAAAYAQGDRVVIQNPDPGFYQPQVVVPNPDPAFSQPHGGYEQINAGPEYVDNGEVRPNLPYPYKQFPYGARGGQ